MNYVSTGYVRTGYVRQDTDTLEGLIFDKYGKHIYISETITEIELAFVYSRFVDWSVVEDNLKMFPAMRYSGYDVIPGGFTGATFFMMNNWKLVYNNSTTTIKGVLFSENYTTGFWGYNTLPIYPVVVAATVNTVFKEVGVSGLTEEESAKLVSLDTTNLDVPISNIQLLINGLQTLLPDERTKLMQTATTGDTVVASQL